MQYSETDRVYDELLLARIRVGDARAGERLAARWHPRLIRTARRLLRNDQQAEVAVQEAWTGICKGWGSLRDPSRFPAWAYRILHNKCANRIGFEQRRRTQVSAEPELEAGEKSTVEDRISVDQAFDQLSAEHRIAATLHFVAGLTLKEIAAVADIPVGTAKSRIFHARKQLQATLNPDPKEKENG